jgi:hypothetical protein
MRNVSRMMIIAALFVSFSAHSENGYKEFKWGATLQSVQAKYSDLKPGVVNDAIDYVILNAFIYQYAHLYENSMPYPVNDLAGQRKELDSGSAGVTFLFLDDKLVGVSVSAVNEPLLPTLQQKYGSVTKQRTYQGELCLWDKDPGRLVMWDKNDFREMVYYFDKALYSRTIKAVQEKEAGLKKTKKALD